MAKNCIFKSETLSPLYDFFSTYSSNTVELDKPKNKEKEVTKVTSRGGFPRMSCFFSLVGYFFEREREKKCSLPKVSCVEGFQFKRLFVLFYKISRSTVMHYDLNHIDKYLLITLPASFCFFRFKKKLLYGRYKWYFILFDVYFVFL